MDHSHEPPDTSLVSDIDLMNSVRDGNVRELGVLFERHHRRLYNFFLRLTRRRQASEDLVQEVFFRILKYRHTFRGDGAFTTWMYHLARNVHNDFLRHQPEDADGDQDTIVSEEPAIHEQLEQKQDQLLLQQALGKLPVEKRELLVLSRYQELHYDAIAEILDCSVGAVKVRIHRAMDELRTIFFQLSGEKTHE